MKWYSVNKYKPVQSGMMFVRAKWTFKSDEDRLEIVYFTDGRYADGRYFEWSGDKEDYEDDMTDKVTHFCIPSPVEIDE
jgi:hypothetical protein